MAKESKKKTNLEAMSRNELGDLVQTLKEEIRKKRFDKALGINAENGSLGFTKRRVARALTAMNGKKVEVANE